MFCRVLILGLGWLVCRLSSGFDRETVVLWGSPGDGVRQVAVVLTLEDGTLEGGSQEATRYRYARVSPGVMPCAYEVYLWHQSAVEAEVMYVKVLLEYEMATRYYHDTVQAPVDTRKAFSLFAVTSGPWSIFHNLGFVGIAFDVVGSRFRQVARDNYVRKLRGYVLLCPTS